MAGRSSIYEVFSSCRLCGGGGGYKMPIMNQVDELDMRHKIRECLRIEVHKDDNMPPLICELCVDKVNDYFEFLEMCRSTDTRTRNRLNLPLPSQTHTESDADCILGVTEPVFVNDDSNDGEPLARQKNRLVVGGKGKRAAPPPPAPAAAARRRLSPVPIVTITRSGLKDKMGVKELRVSINGSPGTRGSGARESRGSGSRESRGSGSRESRGSSSRESSAARASRSTRGAPAPPPAPPARRTRRDDSRETLNKLVKQEKEKKLQTPSPKETRQKSILKAKPKVEESSSLLREKPSKRERAREREAEDATASKRVKIAARPGPASRAEKRRAPTPPRPEPKRRAKPEPPAPPPPQHPCPLCDVRCTKTHNLTSHMRFAHSPTFTLDKLACNACGSWFATVEETAAHHRWHKTAAAPYVCRLCTAEFRQPASYTKHFASRQCVPSTEVPDVQCPTCWGQYATNNLLQQHKCRGEDARPGGNCAKCKRKYATYKTLRKHEEVCCKPGPKSKSGAFKASPEQLKRVTPMQIRVARVDPLLARVKLEQHYDVSHVTPNFGLDKSCVYPYTMRAIKTEPQDYDIDNVKDELFDYQDDFANYESFTDSDSEPEMTSTPAPGPNLVPNPFARKKKKTIDALSTLSIKAIFSSKFLGTKKIQRKRKRRPIIKPEIKTEDENPGERTGGGDAFDSLVNDPIDKEAKKEMIEQTNKQVETANLENGEKSLTDKSDSNIVITDGENTKEDETSLENKSKGDNVEKSQEPTEKLFDDDVTIDQGVSSAVDDLIAGLNDTIDDITDKALQDVQKDTDEKKSEEKGAVDDKKDAEGKTDLESDKKDDHKVNEGDGSLIKEVTSGNEANEKDTETKQDEIKESAMRQESKDTETKEEEIKESVSKQDVESTGDAEPIKDTKEQDSITDDKQSQSLTAGVNNDKKETTQMDVDDDDDFDVNSMFSGDLGATALKSKGEPATSKIDKQDAAESAKTQNEAENPKIDIRLADDIRIADVQNKSEDVLNGENKAAEVIYNSFSDNIKDTVGTKENISVSVDGANLSEEKPVENKLDKSADKLDDKELKPQENDVKEDDLLKDKTKIDDKESKPQENDAKEDDLLKDKTKVDVKESRPQDNDVNEDDLLGDKMSDADLDNLSDTEMDDKELMDELDAQISNNSPNKTADECSAETEKTGEVKEIKEPSTETPEEKNTETPKEEAKAVKLTHERKVSIEAERISEPVKVEEKISLDDLLSPSGAAKSTDDKLRESMDLDCISDDEFNFDA